MVGIFEAVKGKPVTVTAKYTDKSSFAPDNYITSLLYDFDKPLVDVVGKIQSGERGGYYLKVLNWIFQVRNSSLQLLKKQMPVLKNFYP
jgi:hypothetical protein